MSSINSYILFSREVNSEWALEEAKRNVLTKYFLVGVTEQINDFVMVLEANLPTLFKGLTKRLEEGDFMLICVFSMVYAAVIFYVCLLIDECIPYLPIKEYILCPLQYK